MGFVDLHVHSDASDGTMAPGEVVAYAAAKGLVAMALTDHDTVSGLKEAQKAANASGIELVPGIEMSCVYEGTEIHILGLLIHASDPVFLEGLASIRQIRDERNQAMLERFQKDGFRITQEDLMADNPSTVITRSHFAKVLTEKGYTGNRKQAFEQYLQYGGRYCHKKKETTPELAMGLLQACGAFPIIAHPMQYHMGYEQIEQMIRYLKELGLKGVEVYHSSHNQNQSGKLREITRRLELLPSGGSDFHGENKPDIEIGVGRGGLRISHLLLDDIKEAHDGRII